MADRAADDITGKLADLNVLSFRELGDVKRLAKHFRYVISHPLTETNPAILKYLTSLDETHKKIYTQKRESVEVEYIFTTAKKSNLQRQRFNSLQVSEVPELLKAELSTAGSATQLHICTDCNVEIQLNDEEPLMESLQKHFDLEIHLPKPKRDSVDVSEPILLPNMSRRLSSMPSGETNSLDVSHLIKPTTEKLDRNTYTKLSAALGRNLPDNSEGTLGAALKFYTETHTILIQDVANMDFSAQTGSVAPIIMSIRDNVYQNFSADANKSIESEEGELTPEKPKAQPKKYRHYGPIESMIVKLLAEHKLVSLVDDRTGKLAFFCIACEYYTLRFQYDSVLGHVFGEAHVHNLAAVLRADDSVPFAGPDPPSADAIRRLNERFLLRHRVHAHADGWRCRLCAADADADADTLDRAILHLLDERHLARLSDEVYATARNTDAGIPDEWGGKELSWAKYLAGSSKPPNRNDHVIVENFIKPSGKAGNYCACCDITLKGPRQVLFNHIRQKKHLRNAAPRKLAALYANRCRPAEYYASFGNFYVCCVCPGYVAVPSYAAIVEHYESDAHYDAIAALVRCALYPADADADALAHNRITVGNVIECGHCEETFPDVGTAVRHALSSAEHQTAAAEAGARAHRGDMIAVYMRGEYVTHAEGAAFTCAPCARTFTTIRALLTHLVYAEHLPRGTPPPDSVFRFYLELKHNVCMLARNKYSYYQFGRLRCGVCDVDVGAEGENAKRHVMSPRHRDNMGASYVNVSVDAAAGVD